LDNYDPVPHETENHSYYETSSNTRLTSVDSGLQLDLEIALSGVSAKVQPPRAFSARPEMR